MSRVISNRPTWRSKITLASITVLGCLVIAELMLESLRPTAVNKSPPKRSIRLKEHRPTSSTTRERPSSFMKHCEDSKKKQVPLRIDADGFIEPSRVHQNAELEVMFVGGSTTECQFVDENMRFPYLVGRGLETSLSLAVNSYNAGNSGNHSMHSNLILLAKLLPKEPDMVVLMHCFNDLKYLTYTGGYWSNCDDRFLKRAIVVTAPPTRVSARVFAPWTGVKNLLSQTFPELYQRALTVKQWTISSPNKHSKRDEWAQFRNRPLKYDLDALSQQFAKSLTIFCGTCRAYGVDPILMTQAHRAKPPVSPEIVQGWNTATAGMNYDFAKFMQNYEHFNNVIRQVATDQHVLLIDLEKQVPPKQEFMYDVVHFTNRGSELVSLIVTNQLEQFLKEKDKLAATGVSSTFQHHTFANQSVAEQMDNSE